MANDKWMDCVERIGAADAQWMRDHGYAGVIRYIAAKPWHDYAKAITLKEKQAILAVGLELRLCYETTAQFILTDDTAEERKRDRLELNAAFRALGIVDNPILYFAADWDVKPEQYVSVRSFLYSMKSVEYRTGLYGKADLLNWMHASDPGVHLWQSAGWNKGKRSPFAELYQTATGVMVDGIETDTDIPKEDMPMDNNQKDMPTIRLGDTGSVVYIASCLLSAIYQQVFTTRTFNADMDRLVRRYQTQMKFGVDGIIGPETWGGLQSGAATIMANEAKIPAVRAAVSQFIKF